MTLSSAFNIINSAFTTIGTQSSTIASNIANANTPGYSREIANQVTDPFGGVGDRLGDPRGQRRAARSGQLRDVGIGDAERDLRRALDACADRQRFLELDVDAARSQNGNSPSAMLGELSTTRWSTYEADADQRAVRAGRGDGGAESRRFAQRRRARPSPGAHAGRSEHRHGGRDRQFAARPVPDRQQRHRHRASPAARTSARRRISAIRSSPRSRSRSASRLRPTRTDRCRSTPTAASRCSR